MKTVIIAEKGSQARDIRAAIGDRHGQILPAEGHLLRLAEPQEVDPAWQKWSFVLLKPEGLYPTKLDRGGNKSAKFKAIQQALKSASRVIIATDWSGGTIGQEILEHQFLRVCGEVHAKDRRRYGRPFEVRPHDEYRPLSAAVARQQATRSSSLPTRAAPKPCSQPA